MCVCVKPTFVWNVKQHSRVEVYRGRVEDGGDCAPFLPDHVEEPGVGVDGPETVTPVYHNHILPASC